MKIFKYLQVKFARTELCFTLKVEKVKLIRGYNVEFIGLGLHSIGSLLEWERCRNSRERETERDIFLMLSGSIVICLIQTGGALLHHSLGWGSGMWVCVVCSRRLPLGSVQFGWASYKGREGGGGFGWDRRQEDVEEREGDPKMCWTAVPVKSGSWQSSSIVTTETKPSLHLTRCQWLHHWVSIEEPSLQNTEHWRSASACPVRDWSSYKFCHLNKSQSGGTAFLSYAAFIKMVSLVGPEFC